MGRKVFISVLGAGFYSECKYSANNFLSDDVRFIQEATLKMIVNDEWNCDSKAYFLTTELARKVNWETDDNKRNNPQNLKTEQYESLKSRLNKLKFHFNCIAKDIPDGKNEQEMWQIFDKLYDLIEEGDELYLDLTHSFRYLPMLLLVFGNYVKFLKNAKVVHISYGNFEARNPETNIAPIIDLLPISTLQDWTFASANYLENGIVKRLVDLCNSELKPALFASKGKDENIKNLNRFVNSLNKVVEERINCRGISILCSDNMKILKQTSEKLTNTFIEPLNPLFNKIKESLADFDENENVQNGFAAVKWCLDFGLYQQATTILNENIVTYICYKNGLNWKVESERLLVNTAFNVKIKPIDENFWKVSNSTEIDNEKRNELINKVKDIMQTDEAEKLLKLFVSLTDLRNDFNHAGMRNNPMSADKLKMSIQEKYKSIISIINPC